MTRTRHVLSPVRATFRSVATAVVPEAARLDEQGWAEVEAIVERALSRRPPRIRRQLRLLLRALGAGALLRHGRPFARLDAARRTRLLSKLADSRSTLVRRGFWGLRTLILMGYYARPAAGVEIGYAADARGWEAK